MIEVPCPKCGYVGKVPDNAAGRVATCPKCGAKVRIPGGAAATGKHQAIPPGWVACPACGKPLPEAAKKCRYCGVVVNGNTGRHAAVKGNTGRHGAVGGNTGNHAAIRGDTKRNPAVKNDTDHPKEEKPELEKGFFTYLREFFFAKYARFKGRATQREYWQLWWIPVSLALVAIITNVRLVEAMASGKTNEMMQVRNSLKSIGMVCLISFLPYLALICRRCHDSAKSGWLAWAIALCRVASNFIPNLVIASLLFVAEVALGIVIGIFRGSSEDNQYGPDPYGGNPKRPSKGANIGCIIVVSLLTLSIVASSVRATRIASDPYYQYADKVNALRVKADKGDAEAQCQLGVIYYNGKAVKEDKSAAVEWYRKAAKQGHAGAQNFLGVCYSDGVGVAENAREAVKWFKQAANKGNREAQYNLAMHYLTGEGVAKDANQAIKLLKQSANQGYAEAQMFLNKLGTAGEDDND